MNLNNFKDSIDTTILNRGYDYFLNEAVTHLEHMKLGTWSSLVEGSQDYSVVIKLDNDKIKEWDCDCPYDYGPICKHVVATLYAIENMNKNPDINKKIKSNKTTKKPSSLDEIFSKVSKQELQDFITNSLMGYGYGIESALLARFGQYISGDYREKYQKIVKNIFSSVDDLYDPYNRNSDLSFTLSDSIYALIDSSKSLIENNKLIEASIICQCLIEEFANNIENVDDNVGYILENVFETFQSLFANVDENLKDELFYYCLKEYPKGKYQDYGYDDNFLFCLQELISNKEHQDIFIEMLDAQIQQAKRTDSSYQYIKYHKIKYNFFVGNEDHEQASLLLSENLQHQEFRAIAIDKAIKSKEFPQAKKLCLNGIKIAQENSQLGSISDLQNFLLQIAEEEKDSDEICKWSEILFNKTYRDMFYYKKLKSATPKNQWVEKCESIIDKIKGRNAYGGYGDADDLAKIFIVEKYFDRLLKLLQLNADKIQFIDSYAQSLSKLYPEQIVDLYASGIRKYAEKTGRPIYNQLVEYIKAMSVISNSKFMVEELIQYFKGKYKNRPAMMEILSNRFPNQFK